MTAWIVRVERATRYVMAGIALLALLGWAAMEQGWIATAPTYRHDAWYLVGGSAGLVITTEYLDEASCRRQQEGRAVCQSGRSLIRQSLARPGERG